MGKFATDGHKGVRGNSGTSKGRTLKAKAQAARPFCHKAVSLLSAFALAFMMIPAQAFAQASQQTPQPAASQASPAESASTSSTSAAASASSQQSASAGSSASSASATSASASTPSAPATGRQAASNLSAVYVSASGSDETGDGSAAAPYATPAAAYAAAADGATIYVSGTVTVSESGAIIAAEGKSAAVTSTGERATLAAGWAPAAGQGMFATVGASATITFTNIVLDGASVAAAGSLVAVSGDGTAVFGKNAVVEHAGGGASAISLAGAKGKASLQDGSSVTGNAGTAAVDVESGTLEVSGSASVTGNTSKAADGTVSASNVRLAAGAVVTVAGDLSGTLGVTAEGRSSAGAVIGADPSGPHAVDGAIVDNADASLTGAHASGDATQIVWKSAQAAESNASASAAPSAASAPTSASSGASDSAAASAAVAASPQALSTQSPLTAQSKSAVYVEYASNAQLVAAQDGSFQYPYTTLGRAYSEVADGGTIYLKWNVVANDASKVLDAGTGQKDVTITSCDDITGAPTSTDLRTIRLRWGSSSDYLPAVSVHSGTVTFTNIILDGRSMEASAQSGIISMWESGNVVIGSGCTVEGAAGASHGVYGNYGYKGTITVEPGSTLSGNATTGDGGAICTHGGTLQVNGGTFSGNTATGNGGAMYVGADTCSIGGTSTFTGNTAGGNGGAVYEKMRVCDFTGSVTFSGNTAKGNGGAVYAGYSAAGVGGVHFAGATFTGNTATDGGAVCVDNNNMENSIYQSTFTGNTATGNGGALYWNGTGTIDSTTQIGTRDSGNTAGGNGGGIYLNSTSDTQTLNFSGSVVNNSAAGLGGGVYAASGVLSLGGCPVIEGNTAQGTARSDVYLPQGEYIGVSGDLDVNASVGIDCDDARSVSGGYFGNAASSTAALGKIFNDSNPLLVGVHSSQSPEQLVWKQLSTYVSSTGSDSTGDGSLAKPYATLYAACQRSASNSTIYVVNDLSVGTAGSMVVMKGKHFDVTSCDANGVPASSASGAHTITSTKAYPYVASIGGSVNFTNITLNGGGVEPSGNYGIVVLQDAGSVTIGSGCTITGAAGSNHGIYAYALGDSVFSGTVTVEPGASISGNTTTDDGAGVYLPNGGTLHVNGGTFSNNKAQQGKGGAFYLRTDTTGNYIDAATMEDDKAVQGGSNIYYVGGQNGTLSTGKDTRIHTNSQSAGDFVDAEEPIIQESGTLTVAGYVYGAWSGVITLNGGTLNMTSTSSVDSDYAHYGISVGDGATLNMAGTISIGSTGYPGIVSSGTLNMTGNVSYCGRGIDIKGGTAEISGSVKNNRGASGIYMSGGTATVSGPITGNSAHDGGGVYLTGGTLTITGLVNDNESDAYTRGDWPSIPGAGGGIFQSNGTLNMYGRVKDNYTHEPVLFGGVLGDGGGVCQVGGTSNYYGSVTGNKAQTGAGIYVKGGVSSVHGTVSGNVADIHGSGIALGPNASLYLDGTVVGNSSSTDYANAAVYVGMDDSKSAKLYLSGDARVTGNGGKDVELTNDGQIYVNGKLSQEASVGIIGPKDTHNVGDRLGNISVASAANEGAIFSDYDSSLTATRDSADSTKLVWGRAKVYVSSKGSDSNNGTLGSPFATLAKAASVVSDQGTIYVVDDLTISAAGSLVLPQVKGVTVTSCDASGNAASSAAGAHSVKVTDSAAAPAANIGLGSVAFTNITLDGGGAKAAGSSGLVEVSGTGNVTVGSGCTVTGTAGAGHGIYAADGYAGTVSVESGAAFTGNATTVNGAAICLANGGTLNVSGGTFTGNTADGNGGAISCNNDASTAAFTLANCTFTGNKAGGNGGAIYLENGEVGLSDTVHVTGNTGAGGADNLYANKRAVNVVGNLTSDSVVGVRGSIEPKVGGKVGSATLTYTNINTIKCDEDASLKAVRDGSGQIVWTAEFSVTNNIAGGSVAGAATAAYGTEFTETIAPTDPRALPTSVSVSVGGIQLAAGSYSYDPATGTVTIPAARVTGNIVVTASCAKGPASANPITATDYAGTYDGAAHTITATAELAGSTLYYSTDDKTWSATAPTWTDATDAQTVYVKATNPDCEDSFGSATVAIAKASGNFVEATDYSGTYDGQEHTISASALEAGSTLYYSKVGGADATDWSTDPVTFWRSTLDGSGNVVAKTVYIKATNSNYEDAYGSGAVTISKRTVTITASSATVAYTGAEQSIFAGTYQGIASGDRLSARDPQNPYESMPYICKGTDAGTYEGHLESGKSMDVLAKVVSAHGGGAAGDDVTDCYTMSLVVGTLVIEKAAGNTVSAQNQSAVYDATEHTFAASAVKAGSTLLYSTVDPATATDSDWKTVPPTLTDVGTETVWVKATNPNYKDTTVASATFSVTAAPVTVTANDKTKAFSAADPTLDATVSGILGTDTVSYTFSRAPGETVGTYAITPVGASAQGNYSVTFVPGTLTITKADAAGNAVTATNYDGTYDAAAHTITVSVPQTGSTLYYSKVGGMSATDWSTTAPTWTDVTAAQTVFVKATNPDYEDSYDQATVTIAQAPLTITAGSAQFVQDGSAHSDSSWSVTSGRLFGSDAITVVISGSITDVAQTPVANVVGAVTFTVGSAANYAISKVNGQLTMTAARVNPVTATAYSGTYDGRAHAITASAAQTGSTLYYSKVGGASATDWSTTAPTWTDVTAAQTVFVKATNPDYEDSYGQATVTIAQAPVTVTVQDVSKAYGAPNPTLTALVSGTFGTDTVVYTLSRTAGENAGTYTISAAGAASQGNYSVTYVPGTLTITKAPASLNLVTATNYDGTYDGSPHTVTASVAKAGSTIYYSTDNATWSTTAPTWTDATSATTVYVKATNPNYADATADATVTIAQKPVTVTPQDVSKSYGESNPVLAATTSGTLGAGTVVYTLSRTAGENVGTYTITAAGEASQGNYSVTYGTGTFTIDAESIIPDVSIDAQTYTGNALTPTATISFKEGVQTITLTAGTDYDITFDGTTNKNVGTATCTIKLKGNYEGMTTAHFLITPMTVAAPTCTPSLEYNGTVQTAASAPVGARFSIVGGSAKDAGAYTAVAVLSDKANTVWADGSAADKTYAWTITPASATVTAQGASKAYGAADPALTAKVSGMIGSDTVAYTLSRAAGEDVGTYAITPTGAAAQGNYAVAYAPGTLTIANADASGATVDAVPAQLWTGSAIEPALAVRLGGKVLVPGTDYKVTYRDNIGMGTAEYTVEFQGGYAGTAGKTGTFRIVADASGAVISGIESSYTYTGSAIEPAPTVTLGGTPLVAGTDYTVAYTDNANAGRAGWTVTFSDAYGGLVRRGTFGIAKAALSATYAGETVAYGTAPKLAVDVTGFVNGETAATADGYAAPTVTAPGTDVGDYQLTPAGGAARNYGFSYTGGALVIVPADASSAAVSGIDSSYTYTGSVIAPAPTVALGSKTLVAGTDYDVAYSGNTDPGQASYTITFKGDYKGSKSGTFTITARREAALVDGTGTGVSQANGGLDKVLAAVAVASPNAKSIVVDLKVTEASATAKPALAIRALSAASGLTFERFYDAVLTKTVDGSITDIGSSNDVLVGASYPFDFSGKDQVRVFACHDGQAYELTETPNSYGEYVVLDRAGGTVAVYAKRYSTFAVGYTAASGTSSTTAASSASPKTADATAPWALGLLVLALAGAGCASFARRRRNR